jgi:RNA polymerase sigma-70 factor (ECF subfamily)
VTPGERERLFVEIFEANRPRLLRMCAAYLGSAADADDLFQDVMVNVWNGLPRFRHDADPSTWVYRIAVNTALMWRRTRAREAVTIDRRAVDAGDVAAPGPAGPEEAATLAALHAAIAALPPPDRICIALLLDGMSYKDIAGITGLTVNHVGVRISRAKRALSARMKDSSRG